MKKPVIGIIGRSFNVDDHSTIQLGEDYRIATILSGGLPIIVLPTNNINYGKTRPRDAKRLTSEEKDELMQVLKMCDGFIMPRGTQWYDFDETICTYALENDIPILGICLGLQVLGNIDTFFKEEQLKKTEENKTKIHMQEDVLYAHEIEIFEGKVKEILKAERLKVNSRHNFHILNKDYFKVEAVAEDGQIEAISIPSKKFALAVQWHPENMIKEEPVMLEIFKEFVTACTKKD